MEVNARFTNITFSVSESDTLSSETLGQIHAFFEKTYVQPNHDYLDTSLQRLRYIALALKEEKLIGMALADTRFEKLPGFSEPQLLTLGGIGCIDAEYRRVGVFSHISHLAGTANGLVERAKERILACGRAAHPASFRSITRYPTVIPKFSVPLTAWQWDVASAVAELYGVTLKPNSMVVVGSGKPIGYPNVDIDVEKDEWQIFQDVDRDKGENLLALAWIPDLPEGW